MIFDIFHFSIKYHQILWSLINILRKFLRKSTQVVILPSNLIIYILLFALSSLICTIAGAVTSLILLPRVT